MFFKYKVCFCVDCETSIKLAAKIDLKLGNVLRRVRELILVCWEASRQRDINEGVLEQNVTDRGGTQCSSLST